MLCWAFPRITWSCSSKGFGLGPLKAHLVIISLPNHGELIGGKIAMGDASAAPAADEDLLLKQFFSEVSEVERDNEVNRILSCFKLNAFEYLNIPFDASLDDVKRQYRKLSLLVHPDKCKHPQAKEAFAALAKAQQLLNDPQEREYLLNQVSAAKGELRAKRKKQLKKDTASKLKSLVDEVRLIYSNMIS
ncbi:J domain-containing protein spf31 [Dorcoceras hygrometricum]|uniref:J domain-containing protein spf31 n=1 Tax=Dorcoceras hygrometricum TaxID=472368 RepID=A0A2Z7DF77_9LAMI|nr:J domain-containing protein spf31 [Dorcoceras hygrometricum]